MGNQASWESRRVAVGRKVEPVAVGKIVGLAAFDGHP